MSCVFLLDVRSVLVVECQRRSLCRPPFMIHSCRMSRNAKWMHEVLHFRCIFVLHCVVPLLLRWSCFVVPLLLLRWSFVAAPLVLCCCFLFVPYPCRAVTKGAKIMNQSLSGLFPSCRSTFVPSMDDVS